MNTIEQLKKDITQFTWVEAKDFPNYSERTFRRAISELRKDGIVYIPAYNDHCYNLAGTLTEEQIQAFADRQLAHLVTQYQNTILPIKHLIKDDKLKKFMGQLV